MERNCNNERKVCPTEAESVATGRSRIQKTGSPFGISLSLVPLPCKNRQQFDTLLKVQQTVQLCQETNVVAVHPQVVRNMEGPPTCLISSFSVSVIFSGLKKAVCFRSRRPEEAFSD